MYRPSTNNSVSSHMDLCPLALHNPSCLMHAHIVHQGVLEECVTILSHPHIAHVSGSSSRPAAVDAFRRMQAEKDELSQQIKRDAARQDLETWMKLHAKKMEEIAAKYGGTVRAFELANPKLAAKAEKPPQKAKKVRMVSLSKISKKRAEAAASPKKATPQKKAGEMPKLGQSSKASKEVSSTGKGARTGRVTRGSTEKAKKKADAKKGAPAVGGKSKAAAAVASGGRGEKRKAREAAGAKKRGRPAVGAGGVAPKAKAPGKEAVPKVVLPTSAAGVSRSSRVLQHGTAVLVPGT